MRDNFNRFNVISGLINLASGFTGGAVLGAEGIKNMAPDEKMFVSGISGSLFGATAASAAILDVLPRSNKTETLPEKYNRWAANAFYGAVFSPTFQSLGAVLGVTARELYDYLFS